MAAFAFSEEQEQNQQPEIAEKCDIPSIPKEACLVENVFLCNMGFNVDGERSMLFFYIASDAACSTKLFESKKFVYDNTQGMPTRFFLVEDEDQASPLSLTLAGSLAMSATLNNRSVTIVYKKFKNEAYGGTRLLSIEFYNPSNP